MMHYWTASALVLAMATGSSTPAVPSGLEAFSFVVGEWRGTFKGYPTKMMPNGFEAAGTMTSRWGAHHAWIESEAATEIPGLGPYVVKVVVAYDGQGKSLDSFVVNNVGTAGRYRGTIEGNRAVFVGKIRNITQRVSYENLSPTE